MFASRYFNPRYWAKRYWPKVGGIPIDTPDQTFAVRGIITESTAITGLILETGVSVQGIITDSIGVKGKI